ncbi:hypothetical protein BC826DRAFT_1070317, partial [Russula brevipes]
SHLNLALLTHRKTLAPISVLPPEVLARIFHLVALPKPADRTAELQCSLTCAATRARSLDDSSLWAMISGNQASTLYRPHRSPRRLVRARIAPLATCSGRRMRRSWHVPRALRAYTRVPPSQPGHAPL